MKIELEEKRFLIDFINKAHSISQEEKELLLGFMDDENIAEEVIDALSLMFVIEDKRLKSESYHLKNELFSLYEDRENARSRMQEISDKYPEYIEEELQKAIQEIDEIDKDYDEKEEQLVKSEEEVQKIEDIRSSLGI
ncbi:MAG: hypothetical protein N4A36_02455 [Candidatus Gracilibacteria bacterium]|jgi:hypothetical protein|nr:hypothetical protein [Candidatus Gracilibacteria bacterium]